MIHVVVAILLVALLTGCVAEPVTTTPQPKGGTLYITVNPVIAVTYDADGNVTAVTAVTKDAKSIVDSYQDFAGKECTAVVTELVTKVGEEGYLSEDTEDITIAITFETESGVPDEDFLVNMEQQVQTVVTNNHWQGTVTLEGPALTPPPEDPTLTTTAPATSSPGPVDSTTLPSSPDDSTQVTEPPVTEPNPPGKVPANAQKQPDGSYILTEPLDANGDPAGSQSETVYILTTVYNADGIKLSQTNCYANGVMFFYQEFYPPPAIPKITNDGMTTVR